MIGNEQLGCKHVDHAFCCASKFVVSLRKPDIWSGCNKWNMCLEEEDRVGSSSDIGYSWDTAYLKIEKKAPSAGFKQTECGMVQYNIMDSWNVA